MKLQHWAWLAMLLPAIAWSADSLYVQSRQATLHQAPDLDAADTLTLDRGDEVILIESRDRWHKVQAAGQQGWMPQLLLGRQKPKARRSRLEGTTELDDSPRRRASEASTAGAVRGLESDDAVLDDPNLDMEQLRRLESFGVSREQAARFLLEE